MIPYELKKKCVSLYKQGKTKRQVYDEVFHNVHPEMAFETFKTKMWDWQKKIVYADDFTLHSGTYEGFTAHDATVQVDSEGRIRQAWIKQSENEIDYEKIIDAFKDNIKIEEIEPCKHDGESMLEIPLFDMHFGVAALDDYKPMLEQLLDIISSKYYDEINVAFGQDMIHTNDMRGHTAKGTDIGKIDIPKAWNDVWTMWHNVLTTCLKHSKKVNMIYSKGNHDECISWAAFKALEVAFPQIHFDDSLAPRKAIHWNRCFIGISHGEEKRAGEKDFRGRFVYTFAQQFADSDVREIHLGHLHCESERGDQYGVLVRRLSSAVPTDDWTLEQGYVGAHKRFMIFEWKPGRLSAIYYI